MEADNRKFTILSFFLFSALCGYVIFLAASEVADILKIGAGRLIGDYSWNVVGGVGSGLLAFLLFIILSVNSTATAFIDDVFAEVRKTTWPGAKETRASTIVVTIMVTISAFLFFVMDYVWGVVFRLLL